MIHNDEKYRKQIVERKTKIPKLYQGIYTKAVSGRSHKAAIHIQCPEFCRRRIRVGCLYPYRPQSRALQGVPESISEKLESLNLEQENKEEKQEGTLEPKPPKVFQNIAWIMKYGRKHLVVILLAIFLLLVYWGYKSGFFSGFYHPSKNETLNGCESIHLYLQIPKRVNEKLNLQIFINSGKMHPATKHDNNFIPYKSNSAPSTSKKSAPQNTPTSNRSCPKSPRGALSGHRGD